MHAYDIPENIPFASLMSRLVEVAESLARLDERVKARGFGEGVAARLLYHEACASRLAEGELIHLEDLVLMDGGAYDGPMSPELSSGWETLRVWRKALAGDAGELLRAERPGEADAAALKVVAAPDYFFDPNWD